MNDTSVHPPKWPIIIGTLTFLYGLFLFIFYRPSVETSALSLALNISAILCLVAGSAGLLFRKPWGTKLLLWGSWLCVLNGVNVLFIAIFFIGGVPPFFVMLGMLTMMIPWYGWPVFLLIWLKKHKLQDEDGAIDVWDET